MPDEQRQLAGALERVGGLIEQHVVRVATWTLGAVERESGGLEAHVLVGVGRSPAHMRFRLRHAGAGVTEVQIEIVAKSRWCTRGLCFRRSHALLDRVEAQL